MSCLGLFSASKSISFSVTICTITRNALGSAVVNVCIIGETRCYFVHYYVRIDITKSTLFLCGKAEDVLSKHLEAPLEVQGDIVGVVDPPRTGLREFLY